MFVDTFITRPILASVCSLVLILAVIRQRTVDTLADLEAETAECGSPQR